MILSKHNEKPRKFKFFAGKYLPTIHEIFVQKIPYNPYSNCFDDNFFIQFFGRTFCDKLNAQLCQENISSRFNQLQNICKKTLSGTRKHTLDHGNNQGGQSHD